MTPRVRFHAVRRAAPFLATAVVLLSTGGPAFAVCEPDPVLGSICVMAVDFCPDPEYKPADGRQLLISEHSSLFSLLGTTYGGDGRTVFNLPDMRGRTQVGAGQSPDLTRNVWQGESFGTSRPLTLTAENLPAHTHTMRASNADGDTTAASGAIPAAVTSGNGKTAVRAKAYAAPAAGVETFLLNEETVSMAGNADVAPKITAYPPRIALRYCIAVEGSYPPRP